MRPARRYHSQSGMTGPTASRRTTRGIGGSRQPGRTGRAQVREADGEPGQDLDGLDERGQYDNKDRKSWKA